MAYRDVTPFFRACQTGKLEDAVRIADDMHITGEIVRIDGNLLFMKVCAGGHIGVARWMVEKYKFTWADVSFALKILAELGYVDFVRWLLDFLGPSSEELAVVYEEIYRPLPAIRNLFATWRPPPGPGDKSAQD